jgi:hypothetical protein
MLICSPAISGLAPLLEAIRAGYEAHKGRANPLVRVDEDCATVTLNSFRFHIHYSCEAHVVVESAEIAKIFGAAHPQRATIATASRRYELSSDGDPQMEYFNDMLFISEAALSLPGVYVFDLEAGAFQ